MIDPRIPGSHELVFNVAYTHNLQLNTAPPPASPPKNVESLQNLKTHRGRSWVTEHVPTAYTDPIVWGPPMYGLASCE